MNEIEEQKEDQIVINQDSLSQSPLWNGRPSQQFQEVTLSETIITDDYAHLVEPQHYKYYKKIEEPKFNVLVQSYRPDHADIFFITESAGKVRQIFDDEYTPEEEEKYEKFITKLMEIVEEDKQHLEEADPEELNWFHILLKTEKHEIMRMLTIWKNNFDRVISDCELSLEWKKQLEPIVLNENMREMLDIGLFYIYGRDRSLNPINILYPYKFESWKGDFKDLHRILHFVDKYQIDNMMVVGKVQCWNTIMDLTNASLNTLSISDIKKMIGIFNHNYYSRNRYWFMVNVSTTVRFVWMWVRPFIDGITREKVILDKSNTWETLMKIVHPKQLEKRYGGQANDLENYWPPICSSTEYGVDPNKLQDWNFSNKTFRMSSVQLNSESMNSCSDYCWTIF